MSKSDRIKEELAWLKIVFAIFIAIDASLVAWLAQNFDSTSKILVVFGFLGVIFATVVVIWVNRAAIQRFKELEVE
ncbi:MAG: hypothetical protein ACRER2_03935 [Methylococcales bacterium]